MKPAFNLRDRLRESTRDAILDAAASAFNAGGYSLCGKAYLGAKVNELGGKVHYTACPVPGAPAGGAGGGGSAGVVDFG